MTTTPVTNQSLTTVRKIHTTEYLVSRLHQYEVPVHLHEGIISYIREGRPTGSFLRAVLANDLVEAALRADLQNRRCLANVALFVYHTMPSGAWMSAEQVDIWLAAHRERLTLGRTS